MNFLAHLFLSDPDPHYRIGSLLGDFTSVSSAELPMHFNSQICAGVIRHRAVDTFTDTSPHLKAAVALIFGNHRHFSRIALDVYFDHMLSKHWNRFSRMELNSFIDENYQSFTIIPADLPSKFRDFLFNLVKYDILRIYGSLDGVAEVLHRVDKKNQFGGKLELCFEGLVNHSEAIENQFFCFFQQICKVASKEWGWKNDHFINV